MTVFVLHEKRHPFDRIRGVFATLRRAKQEAINVAQSCNVTIEPVYTEHNADWSATVLDIGFPDADTDMRFYIEEWDVIS